MLPIVDVFSLPYEKWSQRKATEQESLEHYKKHGAISLEVDHERIAKISNAKEAAIYIAEVGADNGLEFFIDRALSNSESFQEWRKYFPKLTPSSLKDYQEIYPYHNSISVDFEINSYGFPLAVGQMLFHGGRWPDPASTKFRTIAPLSTTFCPQVALRNAEHKGKAYEQNRIDLFVLHVAAPSTKVFSFPLHNSDMAHEKEVLFASGANLEIRSETKILDDYSAFNCYGSRKTIPIYVLEVDIS